MWFPLFHKVSPRFKWHGTRTHLWRVSDREARGSVHVCGGWIVIDFVLICLSGRGAGFLPGWSNGFSSAWWTSSEPASPSASPRWEAVPPGSRLDRGDKKQKGFLSVFLTLQLTNNGLIWKVRRKDASIGRWETLKHSLWLWATCKSSNKKCGMFCEQTVTTKFLFQVIFCGVGPAWPDAAHGTVS